MEAIGFLHALIRPLGMEGPALKEETRTAPINFYLI